MAARSPGSTFLDFGDPLGGLGQTLMQLAIQRQQLDLQKERLKLDKQEFEQKQAQTQGGARAAAQPLMQGVAESLPVLPGMGGMPVANPSFSGQPPVPALGDFMSTMNDPRLNDATKLAMVQSGTGADRQGIAQRYTQQRAMQKLKAISTPEDYAKYEAVRMLEQAGAAVSTLDWALPESLKERADRLHVEEQTKTLKDAAAADLLANQTLAARGVNVPVKGSREELTRLNDFELQAELTREGRTIEQMESLRTGFFASQTVKDAQTMASQYERIHNLSTTRTGASDTAMVYSFIRLLDSLTGVREAEQRTATTISGWKSIAESYLNRIKGQGTLDDKARNELVESSRVLVDSQRPNFDSLKRWYDQAAVAAKADPTRVTADPYEEMLKRIDAKLQERVRKASGGKQ